MRQQKSKAQQIHDMYSQGAYIWQIARALDITEAEVVATLGLGQAQIIAQTEFKGKESQKKF